MRDDAQRCAPAGRSTSLRGAACADSSAVSSAGLSEPRHGARPPRFSTPLTVGQLPGAYWRCTRLKLGSFNVAIESQFFYHLSCFDTSNLPSNTVSEPLHCRSACRSP
jgi:hypothetical protein